MPITGASVNNRHKENIMRLDAYDDMMGLEFADYEGLDFMNPEMIKEALLAATAGGGALLATAWGVKKLGTQFDLASKIPNPLIRSAVTAGATFLAGLVGGRMLYEYNREAAMGVVGGVGALAMASFIDTAIAQATGNAPMGVALADVHDEYSPTSYSDGMAALAALETTGVTSAPGAFQGFSDPTVSTESLMGLQGTVVQQETLGGLEAYAPYLS
jgi:hypothetical protein